MLDTRKHYSLQPNILIQTAICDCFSEISVRRQGDLQVCPPSLDECRAIARAYPWALIPCTRKPTGVSCSKGTARTISIWVVAEKPWRDRVLTSPPLYGSSRRGKSSSIRFIESGDSWGSVVKILFKDLFKGQDFSVSWDLSNVGWKEEQADNFPFFFFLRLNGHADKRFAVASAVRVFVLVGGLKKHWAGKVYHWFLLLILFSVA